MLQRNDFIRQSLGLHLFFARIMKEHSFFLQVSFTPRDVKFAQRAEEFKNEFTEVLADVIALSDGVVSPDILHSGEVFTQFTLEAEKVTEFYTGVSLDSRLTEAEKGLGHGPVNQLSQTLERRVAMVNRRVLGLLNDLIRFKNTVLCNMLECKMYTTNYPLLIEHIMREACFYQRLVKRLQNREEISIQKEIFEQEYFWNRIMGEHAKFIRGLLDPTEEELFRTADNFGNEFDRLTFEAKEAMDTTRPSGHSLTEQSLRATTDIRDFKAAGAEGILDCKIRSIIIPLLADHVLREANHYLRLLKIFECV